MKLSLVSRLHAKIIEEQDGSCLHSQKVSQGRDRCSHVPAKEETDVSARRASKEPGSDQTKGRDAPEHLRDSRH